jgi:hypothetical protein
MLTAFVYTAHAPAAATSEHFPPTADCIVLQAVLLPLHRSCQACGRSSAGWQYLCGTAPHASHLGGQPQQQVEQHKVVTFQLLAGHWPDSSDAMAGFLTC